MEVLEFNSVVRCGIWIFICFLFYLTGGTPTFQRFGVYKGRANVNNPDTNQVFTNKTTAKCLMECVFTNGCISINSNNVTQLCELSQYFPIALDLTGEPNWRVIYSKGFPALRAWQTSTFVSENIRLVADLAIDGYVKPEDKNSCAHTKHSYSFWAMEMTEARLVTAVVLFFRNGRFAYRNRDLTFRVCSTQTDCDNENGTICATYGGPPIDSSQPIQVTCLNPVYGKFLKIRHNYNDHLQLCEVFVF